MSSITYLVCYLCTFLGGMVKVETSVSVLINIISTLGWRKFHKSLCQLVGYYLE